jgi:NAD(P)-dependent dehydrogenase (short-subunit alcohol dehydrogenase family)
MDEKKKVALVTGSSTGIGFETSLALARNGFHTYATMRKLKDSDIIIDISRKEQLPLEVLPLDVNNDKSIIDTITKINEENKRIDVLVNNAGYALAGPLEGTSMEEEIRPQFETNFFGAIKVMQSVIPIMRKQRNGRIVNITSMGGRVAVPLDPIYHGTKFALEGVSECIRYELGPFGIKIILVEPGAVESNFWKNLKMTLESSSPHSPYRQTIDNVSEIFSKMTENVIHPSEVSKVVVEAVTADNPEFRYIVGKDATMIIDKKKNLSEREFEHFIKEQFNLKY